MGRRSIAAKVDIPKGAIITEEMLDIRRPETGIESSYLEEISGARAKVEIKRDDRIAWSKIEAGH